MTGSFRLGSQIQVDGPLSAIRNAMNINRPLSVRTTATAQIFAGLTHYLLEEYDEALTGFQTALDTFDQNDTEGQEVLYTLIGNTYGRLASVVGLNTKPSLRTKRDGIISSAKERRNE